CLLVMIPLGAQTDPGGSASPSATPSASPSASPSQSDQLTVVERNQYGEKTTAQSELDRPITVALQGLQNWTKKSGAAPKDLRLYLAGYKLTKSSPTLASVPEEYLSFHLEIDPDDRDAWVQILFEARQVPD